MASKVPTANETKLVVRGAAVRAVAVWVLLPLFFLVTGGSFDWWEAWSWCALLLFPMSFFMVWAARNDPELLARRLKTREQDAAQRERLHRAAMDREGFGGRLDRHCRFRLEPRPGHSARHHVLPR